MTVRQVGSVARRSAGKQTDPGSSLDSAYLSLLNDLLPCPGSSWVRPLPTLMQNPSGGDSVEYTFSRNTRCGGALFFGTEPYRLSFKSS